MARIRREARTGWDAEDIEDTEDRYDEESGPDDVVMDWDGRDELEYRMRPGRSDRWQSVPKRKTLY